MNRPIDWKKISELKRQAPPPDNPLGDMLSELLEVEAAMPGFVEPVYQEIHDEVETIVSEPCGVSVSVVCERSEGVSESQQAVETASPTNASPLPEVVGQAVSLSPSLAIAYHPPTLLIVPEPPTAEIPEVDDLLAMLLAQESKANLGSESVIPANTEIQPLAAAPSPVAQADSFEARTWPRSSLSQEFKAHITRESCLVFSLGGAKFGIPIHQVAELDKLPRITPVPNLPDWVRGVTNLRGEILSVLDLRLLLGMERNGPNALSSLAPLERERILVVRLGEEMTAALVVDEVSGFASYAQDRLTPADAGEGEKVIALLDGICSSEKHALKILNMDKLMATAELRQLEAA